MSSAAEAEFGGIFINSREGENIRTTLEELGHNQAEPTPIATDNSTASGIANETIKQQRSKAMDMRFYWIRDRITQKHFLVYWYPGKLNLGDYHTKNHASKHHQRVRSTYLQEHDSPTDIPTESPGGLRGCVESTSKHVSTKPTIELRTQTNKNYGTQSSRVHLAIRRHQSPIVQSANSRPRTRNQ